MNGRAVTKYCKRLKVTLLQKIKNWGKPWSPIAWKDLAYKTMLFKLFEKKKQLGQTFSKS